MKEKLWTLHIDITLSGNQWGISLTASENGILTMLRTMYAAFEAQMAVMAKTPSSHRPSGLIEEALALLRCLVFCKLEAINGKYINLTNK